MDYVRLGNSGLKVSRIALGCMSFGVQARAWRLDETASMAIIRQALELGITFFDTADMYGAGESEIALGRALASCARRDEVVVATKVYYPVPASPRPSLVPQSRGIWRRLLPHSQ